MRFSDKELVELSERVETHIQEFRAHMVYEEQRWNKLLEAQEENNRQISHLVESTSGLIDAWKAATGAVKVLSTVGEIAKWLASFAVFVAIYHWWVSFTGHQK